MGAARGAFARAARAERMRFVHQSVQAAPSVVMVECRKGGSAEGLVVEPPLIVESDEYFRIYGIEH